MDIKEFTIKTSDKNRDFGTGAQRDQNEDKGRFDLLSPIALLRLAKHTQKGGQIRGDRNWENGMPMYANIDSAIRHLYKYILNVLLGKEQDEDHLAAAFWNIMVTIHTEELVEMGVYPEELANLLGSLDKPYTAESAEEESKYPPGSTAEIFANCEHAEYPEPEDPLAVASIKQKEEERYAHIMGILNGMELRFKALEKLHKTYLPVKKEAKSDTIKYDGPEVQAMKKKLVMGKLHQDLEELGLRKPEEEEEKPETVLCLVDDFTCRFRKVDDTCEAGDLECEYQQDPGKPFCAPDPDCETCEINGVDCAGQEQRMDEQFYADQQKLIDLCKEFNLDPDEIVKSCKNCIFSTIGGTPSIGPHDQCSSCARLSKWSQKPESK